MAGGVPNGYFPSLGPVAIQPAPSINNHHFNGDYYGETANQPGQYSGNSHYANPSSIAQTPGSTAMFSVPPTPGSVATGSVPPTPGSLAGRKRSRGDIYAEVDEESDRLDGSAEAMHRPFELSHIKRPSVSSRKSMRKDTTTTAISADQLGHLLLPPEMREAATGPLIDEATRALGISWTRMDSTEVLQIQRGSYSKWISKHYPGLRDVEVWFENSAIPGYLVEARNDYSGQRGYYIFSNDLTEARLVTTEPLDLVPRLRLLPALHLAAPGGHIRAEMDPITVAQNEVSAAQMNGVAGSDVRDEGGVVSQSEANGTYAAHEMELD
ncbi:hypothetical protein LTR56_019367 [Elasticomyces elasticus]|nr:hypothetical protein LTR56_019367 [Elasticomyces elasticus]KAK3658609.1 hypothetical protein LTR22_008781 [Elasticomyces elasticus]KAK4911381.1 hypothetical protein LTR49_020032 [Elasticomyces elasticus]KAK5747041.1 hypothetical protein LTS12_022507 [Elasticomyces elasticus]